MNLNSPGKAHRVRLGGGGAGGTGTYLVNNSQSLGSETLTVPATSNQIVQVDNQSGAVTRALTYRAGGDLYQDQAVGGALYEYDYNGAKRMVEVQQNGTQEGEYAYDFLGHRVLRQTFSPATKTAYFYDREGHVLAEHNAASGGGGAVELEYIWLDDLPVAMIDSTGTPASYYIHTGQIDEPLALTNSSASLAWNAYVDPFGTATTFSTPSETIGLRLPGQWTQSEANGTSQNRFRDYDPTLGRYVEGDPIGIWGGQNVYAYVDGDPLNMRDPSGRCPTPHLFQVGAPTLCSAPELFNLIAQPGMSAPGAPPITPRDPNSPVTLLFGYPITQSVTLNGGTYTITNTALPPHIFTGTVVIQITPTQYGSYLSITGSGFSPSFINALENDVVGYAFFGGVTTMSVMMICNAYHGASSPLPNVFPH